MSSLPVIEFKGVSKTFNPGQAAASSRHSRTSTSRSRTSPTTASSSRSSGPSGCGKSTILNLIQGFSDVHPPSRARCWFAGRR